jgi:hypothetical protein
VAEGLETAGDPFAVGRGLEHDPGAGPGPQHGVKALRLGPDAPLDHLAALGEDVDLAFPLVHVDAPTTLLRVGDGGQIVAVAFHGTGALGMKLTPKPMRIMTRQATPR